MSSKLQHGPQGLIDSFRAVKGSGNIGIEDHDIRALTILPVIFATHGFGEIKVIFCPQVIFKCKYLAESQLVF